MVSTQCRASPDFRLPVKLSHFIDILAQVFGVRVIVLLTLLAPPDAARNAQSADYELSTLSQNTFSLIFGSPEGPLDLHNETATPSDAEHRTIFLRSESSARLLKLILVENPARICGFQETRSLARRKLFHERSATDSRRAGLTEQFDDGGRNVKGTDEAVMALGNAAANSGS